MASKELLEKVTKRLEITEENFRTQLVATLQLITLLLASSTQ